MLLRKTINNICIYIVEKFYDVLILFLSLLVTPLFLISRRGRTRLRERFGFWSLDLNDVIWFHGASLGEIVGLLPVIAQAKKKYPTYKILVTATSVTGLERAARIADQVRLLPFDSSLWLWIALRRVKLRALVISETEIWPSLIRYVAKRNVSVYLINARISDFSVKRYQLLKSYLGFLFQNLKKILTISEESKMRLIDLGASPEQLLVTGNSKYDFPPAMIDKVEIEKSRKKLFNNSNPILVLGSIRPKEEDVWFPAIKTLKEKGAEFNIIVAPRHEEKFIYFEEKLKNFQFKFEKWSKIKNSIADREVGDVLLLDTMGDLSWVYSGADLAFVGATLVDLGGHNPLEPAAYGAVVCIGPYIKNIRDVVSVLKSEDGIIEVHNISDAERALEAMLAKNQDFLLKGIKAKDVWKKNFGASHRIIEALTLN